jgi:hypothetical protein
MFRRSRLKAEPNPRPVPDYSKLPLYREILPDDWNWPKNTEEEEYRWIMGLKRVDWFKYFAKQTEVHELVVDAAIGVGTNPIAFLKSDWVNRSSQQYLPDCPEWAKTYAENFKEAAKAGNFKEMLEWFEVIQTRLE